VLQIELWFVPDKSFFFYILNLEYHFLIIEFSQNFKFTFQTSVIFPKLLWKCLRILKYPIKTSAISRLLSWYVILPTGSTTTAVPVQKTSSALINSSTGMQRSSTWHIFQKVWWGMTGYSSIISVMSVGKCRDALEHKEAEQSGTNKYARNTKSLVERNKKILCPEENEKIYLLNWRFEV